MIDIGIIIGIDDGVIQQKNIEITNVNDIFDDEESEIFKRIKEAYILQKKEEELHNVDIQS